MSHVPVAAQPDGGTSAVVDFARVDAVAAAVARLLPPSVAPLFDRRFTRSDVLFDEYVHRLTLQVFAECGLDRALGQWSTPGDVAACCGLDPPSSAVPLDWMLRHLAGRGVLAADAGRFRAGHAVAVPDPAPVLAEQRRHDATCLPSYALAETVAQGYPAFLHGERSGEEILFAPRRLALWTSYFSADNPLYAVNNGVGAAAVEAWMPAGGGTLLELGGGLGSGALALLDRLRTSGRGGDIREYRFTEVVPAFLRRGERLLRERMPEAAFLTTAALDMDRPFGAQGVAPGSVSVVYAVNTLHVARDLAFTLAEIRSALQQGGRLVFSECIRPRAGQTIYPEFTFNLMQTFRARGFLTPEQWSAALDDAGFAGITFLPDIARIREVFPGFYAAAIGATRD
ncbi:MAG TPA: methyltransferase [Candidatus Limnocylindria bacterium]|nr:methyltransferase [Candidatus Limnocylindria bacterium]